MKDPRTSPAALDARESEPERESPYKSVGGLRRVVAALGYSLNGLHLALRIESAFRQELTLAALLVPVACFLPLPPLDKLALIASIVLVLIVELINSSIEAAVDRISLDPHRLSGRAKDLGSAAVLLALMLCMLTWVLIAAPAMWSSLSRWL